MIEISQGTPGSGKSASAVARAIRHLNAGGVVAANFSLVDGWCDTIANKHIMSYFSDNYRYEWSKSLWERFHVVKSCEAIKKINPREKACKHYKDNGSYKEGYGLLIIDEAQLIFNSRKWDKNFEWIEFFTQHRKLGWNVILIAHSLDMIDSQIRPLIEYESRFRNLKKVSLPLVPVPMSPINMFLVITRYAGLSAGTGEIFSRDVFPLPTWAAKLYDSCEIFSAENWNNSQEPMLCGRPPAPPLGGGVGACSPKGERKRLPYTPCLNALWDDQFGGLKSCEA